MTFSEWLGPCWLKPTGVVQSEKIELHKGVVQVYFLVFLFFFMQGFRYFVFCFFLVQGTQISCGLRKVLWFTFVIYQSFYSLTTGWLLESVLFIHDTNVLSYRITYIMECMMHSSPLPLPFLPESNHLFLHGWK